MRSLSALAIGFSHRRVFAAFLTAPVSILRMIATIASTLVEIPSSLDKDPQGRDSEVQTEVVYLNGRE
jgi:hypothetical protein